MYLYSNIIGTFVFNQNYQIREKVLFSEKDLKKNFQLMQKGEKLETEKKFLKKFKSIKNLREEHDEKAIENITRELKDYRKEFRQNNIYITKLLIKESVTEDLLVIQLSSTITELNKSINMLSRRLREWYGFALPELGGIITDHQHFAELASKKTPEQLMKEFKIKDTMGADIDISAIKTLASTILELFRQREKKEEELDRLMKKVCPNLREVAGPTIGAKLLTIAGSLREMVMMPASTIQLLGAEKALFRHMTKHAKAPKHGVIIDHPVLQKVSKEDKGKAARTLADKISMAVKIDFFKGKFIGDKLRKEVEDRFK